MDIDLAGRTALVTGSTAGIGFATARELARRDATVWVNGRTQQRVDAAIAALSTSVAGTKLHGVAADVATPHGVETVAQAVPAVDILVNSAGGVLVRKPFEQPK